MSCFNRLRVSKRMLFTLLAIGSYSGFMYLQAQESGSSGNEEVAQVDVFRARAIEPVDQSGFTQQETGGQGSDVTGGREFSRRMEVEESSFRGEFQENQEPYIDDRSSEQYAADRYSSPADDYRPVVSGTSFPVATGRFSPGRRNTSTRPSRVAVSQSSGTPSDPGGEQLASAPVESESPELTPEEINPFLPDGSVADDVTDGNRQAKVECPTFVTGQMKTRYSYKVLESMGCSPGFDY